MEKKIEELVSEFAEHSDAQSEGSFFRTAVEEVASGALEIGAEATSYLIQGMFGTAKAVGDQTADAAEIAVQATTESGAAICDSAVDVVGGLVTGTAEAATNVAVGAGEIAVDALGAVVGVVVEGIASAL